jgi:hypothetical protein
MKQSIKDDFRMLWMVLNLVLGLFNMFLFAVTGNGGCLAAGLLLLGVVGLMIFSKADKTSNDRR